MGTQDKIINKNQEITNVEQENKMYVFYEMRDELEKAVVSLDYVIKQQNELSQIIKNEKENNNNLTLEWEEFIKGLGENTKNYEKQKETLEFRLEKIEELFTFVNSSDDNKEVSNYLITLLLDILGQK